MRTLEQKKLEYIGKATQRFEEMFAAHVKPEAACLLWHDALCYVLNEDGVKGVIQGGSASWRILLPEHDDGVSPTHFSYMFSIEEATPYVEEGMFPEMHVWAYLPDTEEVVDLTTKHQPDQCLLMIGKEWGEGCSPPDYIWETVEDFAKKELGRYAADRNACFLSEMMVRSFYKSVLNLPYWK